MVLESKVTWHDFGSDDCLKNALGITAVALRNDTQAFTQLRYIEQYARDLKCVCFAIETPYIDRDYIEDHSAFYSKNLFPYPNSCKRVHFFASREADVRHRMRATLGAAETGGLSAYKQACQELSEDQYLGFSVIKPLAGTPVGRTVMKCFAKHPDHSDYIRRFTCTRDYKTHFGGCELTVSGLAFQQQDIGVSACATTALWSALQKTADAEPIAAMTPVQITKLATQYSLPSGRPMPSEGLDLGQMCNAVQASGASPNLFRVTGDHNQARYILRSSILSGFPPVLAMYKKSGLVGHAVTAVGLKEESTTDASSVHFHQHEASTLYIHDDRIGPYLRCKYAPAQPGKSLTLQIEHRGGDTPDEWELRYILVPMHPKIRLSFANIEQLSSAIVPDILTCYKLAGKLGFEVGDGTIGFDVRVLRSHRYIEKLLTESNGIDAEHIERISQRVAPARYLAVVRISGQCFSQFDLLIDSTATITNPHFLAGIPTEKGQAGMEMVGKFITEKIVGCPFIT